MRMFIQGAFYDRHTEYIHICMQGVDVGQSSVDPILSGADALHATCMSIVKYA